MGQAAWRMVTELVAGLLVGFGIGLGLDALFGTRPWLLVLFTLLGFWAGIRVMMRTARELQQRSMDAAARPRQNEGKRIVAETNGGLVIRPMDQFIVRPLFGGDTVGMFTITNVTLWMALTVLAIDAAVHGRGTRGRALVPTRVQSMAELAYSFIYKMVEDVPATTR
jgi:hypothetical protein